MNSNITLIYVHDPMCSWCYGFKPALSLLIEKLKHKVTIQYLLGGLATDTDEPMPEAMQKQIKLNWKRIEETIPGCIFNYEFWTSNIPKRSTYPACRAVLAAKNQSVRAEGKMNSAIQKAYYLTAQNPSDYSVLYNIAKEINLDVDQFKFDIHSDKINIDLQRQITLSRKIGADSFPSLFIKVDEIYHPIVLDYNNVDIIIEHINDYL
ncbi:MAG: DsbA family protein [endosymbiont of Galathealinum brachiosum]|uniref:DsbA family protein n=1 Tax=endosymbiont of Galathealinum brachiosum TaxID=2200906 RepID=A0A370DHX2_9GAMM|nr:MAG: DsbA family protein [endosymbiont of Galathealinum brachiosum]